MPAAAPRPMPAAPPGASPFRPRSVGGRSAEPRPGPRPPLGAGRRSRAGDRGPAASWSPEQEATGARRGGCGGPAAAMASLFKKKTVDGEWAPGEASPRPWQRPPPAPARPRARGWSRPGLREPSGHRGLGPRVLAERELRGVRRERSRSGRPRPARRDSPAALGESPRAGPALALRGGGFLALREGWEPGPAIPGRG